jgi:quercetin dioxygenase-like cupin family protein
MRPSDLLNYQQGAVVSKVLLKKKSGNITLFAFSKGEGLSEHTAPFDAFVHVIDGEAEVTVSGKPHMLNAGEAIIMPANEPHALKAVSDFRMLLVMLKDG